MANPSCDIFINHRGIDTKRTISGLLYDYLSRLGSNPFLDSKKMKPGDRLFDRINDAILNCKIGVIVLSPNYCDSYSCLHELAFIMECKKRIIPVFCDVEPSQLYVKEDLTCSPEEFKKFRWALEEAKLTVGISFSTSTGDWSEFLKVATDAIINNFLDLKRHERLSTRNQYMY